MGWFQDYFMDSPIKHMQIHNDNKAKTEQLKNFLLLPVSNALAHYSENQ